MARKPTENQNSAPESTAPTVDDLIRDGILSPFPTEHRYHVLNPIPDEIKDGKMEIWEMPLLGTATQHVMVVVRN